MLCILMMLQQAIADAGGAQNVEAVRVNDECYGWIVDHVGADRNAIPQYITLFGCRLEPDTSLSPGHIQVVPRPRPV
jgi:hypothetical protein